MQKSNRVGRPQIVGASETNMQVSDPFPIRENRSLLVDVAVGAVTSSTGITAKLQDTSGLNLWNDKKTVAITASSNVTLSDVDATTDTLTSNAHGLVDGQPVALSSSGTVPEGLSSNEVYYVFGATTNTFQLSKTPNGGMPVNVVGEGTGTIVVAPVRILSIPLLAEASGDQTHLPLRPVGRLVLSSGAGDSCQIMEITISQNDE